MIPAAFLARVDEPPAAPIAWRAEAPFDVRPVAAIVSVLALQLAAFGLAWDIVWHTYVGRDRFLTVPHVLMYLGVGIAGATILASVLYQTARFHAGSQAGPTARFLGIFHASRGLYVAGCGLLTTALAAPLDNYWHELYGIDVTIWSPFHMMGLFGSAIALTGLLYLLAAVSNDLHSRARLILGFDLYQWLAFLALAGGCALTFVLAEPGMREFPRVVFGPFSFLTTPLICAFGMTLCVSIAMGWSGAAAAAAAALGIYVVRAASFNLLAAAFTRQSVASHALAYRIGGFEPHVNLWNVFMTFTLVPVALFFPLARERGTSLGAGALGAMLFALAASVWVVAAQREYVPLPGIAAPLALPSIGASLVPTLVLAACAGALASYAGRAFAGVLRRE